MADEVIQLFDFSGGVVNTRENPLAFPVNAIQDGENCDFRDKGLATRDGYITALRGPERVLQGDQATVEEVFTHIEQIRFPTNSVSYLLAQITDSGTSKLYASNVQLPTVGTFAEIYDLGSNNDRISVSVLNDRAIITAIGINPLVFSGCLSVDGSDWAVPKQVFGSLTGTNYYDCTSELCDPDDDTDITLTSFPTSGGLYFCLDQKKCGGLYLRMGTGNSATATMIVEKYSSGTWTAVSGLSDGTASGGHTLSQTGVVTWTACETDYQVIGDQPGFWFRLRFSSTLSATVTLRRVLYQAPCQELQSIGADRPMNSLSFLYYDASAVSTKDYTVEVSDNSQLSSAKLNDGNPSSPTGMGTGDSIYIAGLTPFNAVELTPENNHNNQNASILSGYYWNGSTWTALSGFSDGTASGGKTLMQAGKVSFTLPTDWKTHRLNGVYVMGYWIKLSVSASLTARTYLSEARIYPIQEALKKHALCMTVRDRIILLNRPEALDQLDISRKLEEYGWTGDDSYSLRVGGQDGITGCVPIFNQGWIAKVDSWYMLNGYSPSTFAAEAAETAQQTPVNHHCIVRAPIPEQAINKQGAYFLNHTGAWCFTGLQIYKISENVNWWDETVDNPRLDLATLHLCSGVYWPGRNWVIWSVPMLTGVSASQSTCNRLIVYDVSLKTWLPPFTISAASLFTARHYQSDAPGNLGQLGLYCGSYDGFVYRIFNTDNDNGNAVSWWVRTGWMPFGVPHIVKLVRKLIIYGETDSAIVLDFYRDGNDSEEPSARLNISGLSGMQGKVFTEALRGQNLRGSFFRIKISGSGPAKLYGLILGIEAERDTLI